MSTVSGEAVPASAREHRTVRSQPVDLVGTLLQRLPHAGDALSWVRDGQGLVGWGEAARLEISGPDRFARARDWWRELVAHADVEDEVGRPRQRAGRVRIVRLPRRRAVAARRPRGRAGAPRRADLADHDRRPAAAGGARAGARRPAALRYAEGDIPVTGFRAAVAAAVARIAAGDLDKVVLAHDLLAVAEDDIDVRAVLAGLAGGQPGLLDVRGRRAGGGVPELLVRRTGDRVVSRVLAGTTARGGDPADDQSRVDALLHSAKDQEEHRYAVESLVGGAGAARARPRRPDDPARARAVQRHAPRDRRDGHRAGRFGRARPAGRPAPDGGRRWHPRPAALALLADLERMNRGRYTGPVGWVDARGDGEWCIALRCAQLDGRTARLFAGCGIVAGSDPDDEVLEAQAKLVPVRDALEGVSRR